MSKIIQVINAMVSNPKLIGPVLPGGEEILFQYKKKYNWSMKKDSDDNVFYLWYYPENIPLEKLAAHANHGQWEDVVMMAYSSRELGTREARASFEELYTLVREKLFNLDEVFDDILSDDEIPF